MKIEITNYRRTWDPRVEKYKQIKGKGLVRLTTLHQAINKQTESNNQTNREALMPHRCVIL